MYVVPSEEESTKVNEKVTENEHVEINQGELKNKEKEEEEKGDKKEKGHHRQRKSRRNRRRVKPLRSLTAYSDTALYKTLGMPSLLSEFFNVDQIQGCSILSIFEKIDVGLTRYVEK